VFHQGDGVDGWVYDLFELWGVEVWVIWFGFTPQSGRVGTVFVPTRNGFSLFAQAESAINARFEIDVGQYRAA
jgi:hypothetical protein